jgi:hypothetical protein
MTATLTAVYSGGKFHPTTPPDLPDGATVQLTVVAEPTPLPGGKSPGEQAYDIIRAITARHAGKSDPIGDGLAVSENVDKILYGGPEGVR